MTNLEVIESRLRDAEEIRDKEGDLFTAFMKTQGIESVNVLANLSVGLTGEKLAYVCELKNVSAYAFYDDVCDFYKDMSHRCEEDSLVACAFLGVTMALTVLYKHSPDEENIFYTLASALNCYNAITAYAERHDYRDEKRVSISFNIADTITKNKKLIVSFCELTNAYGNFNSSIDANKWKSTHCMNFTKAMLDVLYDSAKKAGDPSAIFEDTGVANLLYRMLINAIGTLADPFYKNNEQMMLVVMFAFLSLYSVTR